MISFFPQLIKASTALLFAIVLLSCDIQAVSIGQWNVSVEDPSGTQNFVWSINSDDSIDVAGGNSVSIDEAVIDGSRVSWSGSFIDSDDEVLEANFTGTVSGNSFQGTVFTQKGNFILRGIRPN